jgi:hypothetical protein
MHGDYIHMSFCSKCGSTIGDPAAKYCPLCGQPLPQTPSPAAEKIIAHPVPWETVGTLGIGTALLRTLRESLLEPFPFFSKVAASGTAGMAFVYALILGSTGSLFSVIWTYLAIDSTLLSWVPWSGMFGDGNDSIAAALVLVPFFSAAKIMASALYFHTLLFVTRTKRRGLNATINVVCYAESTAVLNLIPVAGSAAAFVWSIFLLAVGFSRVHRMSTGKAMLVIILPLLILAAFLILAVSAAVGAGFLIDGFLKDPEALFR